MTQNRQAYWSIIFLIVPNKDGITVLLEKGAESSLTYLNPETNEKFKVYYIYKKLQNSITKAR